MFKNKTIWGQLLLVEVFLMVFFVGFLPSNWHSNIYPSIYSLLFFTCAFNLDRYRKIMLWLAFGAFVLEWIATTFDLPVLNASSKILKVLFFVVIVGFLIYQIAKAKNVKGRVIFEAVNGYLLLGLVFSLMTALTIQIDPTAFNFSASGAFKPNDVIYFSFVTFATLGYGDMLPLEPYSKSLALLTTIGGQLYLAVIIALLVGKFSSRN